MNPLKERRLLLAAAAGAGVAMLIIADLVVLAPAPDVAVVSAMPPNLRSSVAQASLTPATNSAVPVMTPDPSPSSRTIGVEVGELAPDFEARGLDGTTIRLSNYRGRPVWLNLWASWCLPCRTEMPRLESMYLKHKTDGLVVLGIAINDGEASARSFASEVGVTYPLAVDPDGAIAKLYRGVALPVHYWIGRDGTIRDWALGEIPPDFMEAEVQKILR